MVFRKENMHYLIINLLCLVFYSSGSKLNVPRVLLPVFNDVSTKFTLEAKEGGCYTWTTTRPDIISLTPVDENPQLKCSTKLIVATITKEAVRNIAIVLAEDVHTKQNLRCDIIVDTIHSLAISTTTRELFMEDAPETFEVKAHDDQENEFSTLEGIEFEWNIVTLSPKKDSVVRYIPYRDSPYETPPAVASLEDENKKGYIILLEGVKSGSSKISVRLPQPEYKHVETHEVQLMVVANLLISPAEVYCMPGDVVPFQIFYLNNGRMEEIPLPDSQYYIEAEDSNIASSTEQSNGITALKEGKTRIVLRDRNVGVDDPTLKLPAAIVQVVQPNYLIINILPYKNWAILVGDKHDINVEVYSANDHKLYLGSNVKISLEVPPEFAVVDKAPNGTWLTGHGVKPSVAIIKANLENTANPIYTSGDLVIYPRITISPSEVILPWDPVTEPRYDIDLIVRGGDGRFIWTSSDHTIGVVSQSGHVKTLAEGFFEVSAAMLRNHHNRQTAKIIILPPSKLEIIEFVMQAEIGSPVYLHIALYAEKKDEKGQLIQIPFTQCQKLPFQIKQSDEKFKQNNTAIIPPVGVSCGNIAMVGLNVGTSKITISYDHAGKTLQDSVTLSAYRPLELLQPKNDIVISVGSMNNLIYTGGPRPLPGKGSEHQRLVVSEDEKLVQVQDVTQFHNVPGEDITVLQVLCRGLGETDIKLLISNTPMASNCKSPSANITTRIVCGKPRKISLIPEFAISAPDACPMDLTSGSVIIPSSKQVELEVAVYDDCGTLFLNISTFALNWIVEPNTAGDIIIKDGTLPKNITIGTVDIANKSIQIFKPNMVIGKAQLNVSLMYYNNDMLSKYGISPESPVFTDADDKGKPPGIIQTSIFLVFVENAQVSRNEISIFNHPDNKQTVSVSQGSGFFELGLSSDSIAEVQYLEHSQEIEITPLRSGELTIQLKDLCLVSEPATIHLRVVSVGVVRVEMIDKIEIGKCLKCIVRLYDDNDNIMDIPDPGMVGIRPEFENKIANIQQDKMDPQNPWPTGEIHYVLTGVEVGKTKLVFHVGNGLDNIESAPVDLQVFTPIRVHPRNASLLIKSILQYTVKGGPQPDANIEYAVVSSKIAEVTPGGIVTGNCIGTSQIMAKAVGKHPSTGQKIIYSEDTVDIHVVPLQDIKIKTPLTRFQVGALVPFWCFGMPNEISPEILGTIEHPPINFKWHFDQNNIAEKDTIVQQIGVDYRQVHRGVIRLKGLNPGKTRLWVNATVEGMIANKKEPYVMFEATIDIEVVLPFLFTRPKFISGRSLLMAPHSEIPLKTNLDGTPIEILYTLPGTETSSTDVVAQDSTPLKDKIVTISSDGLLKSYGTLGQAMLIIVATDHLGLKQKISIVVEVKTINYINLEIRSDWRVQSKAPFNFIPVGTEFTLKASYHDDVGNKFAAGPLNLHYRTSRNDLIRVCPGPEVGVGSLYIKTIASGNTIIKVWADGIPNGAEYLKIHVDQAIQPLLDHLTVGDILCLYTPVIDKQNSSGHWCSSDPELVSVVPDVKVAFVKNKPGTVVLTNTLLPSYPLQLEILPIAEIEFLPPAGIFLTNGPSAADFRVSVVMHSERSIGMKTNSLISGWKCKYELRKLPRTHIYDCFVRFSNTSDINPEDIFNISHSIVPETGSYACKVGSLGVNNIKIATLETDVLLYVKIIESGLTSKTITLKFYPQVYYPSEITIGETGNTVEFDVTGIPEVLNQLNVEAADTGILHVDSGKRVDKNTHRYRVELLDFHWRLSELEDAMGIHLVSDLTKQNDKIMVRVVGNLDQKMCGTASQSPLLSFFRQYKNALFMCLGMLVIFFLTFYFYSHYMQPVVNVNVSGTQRCGAATPRCAAPCNRSVIPRPYANVSQYSPNSSSNECSSLNQSGSSNRSFCVKPNCSCKRREPVYGDPSSFYAASPDVRRNRRDM